MADYGVTFQTDIDTATHGHPYFRQVHVEAKSPKEAITLALKKLGELAAGGYIRIGDPARLAAEPDLRIDYLRGVRGQVTRDRSSRNMWYTGRGHDDRNDPRWDFVVKSGTSIRFGLDIVMTKVP